MSRLSNNQTENENSLENPNEADKIVRSGGLIAFRTDTFYGLGADPLNPNAVRKIKELKGREENKPILLLISDVDQIDRFIAEPDSYRRIAVQHWPAALTLIGRARP